MYFSQHTGATVEGFNSQRQANKYWMKELNHANIIAVKIKFYGKLPDYFIDYIGSTKLLRALTTNARTTCFLLKHLHH
jgi:hypothetical protein